MVREKVVSLEEEMKAVVERLQSIPHMRLADMATTKSWRELIVLFLAILHLARDQAISLEQNGQFSDILVGRKDGTQDLEHRT